MHDTTAAGETILQCAPPSMRRETRPEMLRLIPPLLFALFALGALAVALDETVQREAPGSALVEAWMRAQGGAAEGR